MRRCLSTTLPITSYSICQAANKINSIAQNFLIGVTLISQGMFKSPALFTARPSLSIVLNFRGIAQGDTFDVAVIIIWRNGCTNQMRMRINAVISFAALFKKIPITYIDTTAHASFSVCIAHNSNQIISMFFYHK